MKVLEFTRGQRRKDCKSEMPSPALAPRNLIDQAGMIR